MVPPLNVILPNTANPALPQVNPPMSQPQSNQWYQQQQKPSQTSTLGFHNGRNPSRFTNKSPVPANILMSPEQLKKSQDMENQQNIERYKYMRQQQLNGVGPQPQDIQTMQNLFGSIHQLFQGIHGPEQGTQHFVNFIRTIFGGQ